MARIGRGGVDMKSLRIDEEFRSVIPPLSDDEYRTLEASILEEGIRDAIVATTDGVILDGHNRFDIAKKHDVSDDLIPVDRHYFETREEAMIWMIDNQRGRRNLTKQAWLDLGFKRAELLKPRAEANQKAGLKQYQDDPAFQESEKRAPVNTVKEAADYAGVSVDTAAGKTQLNPEFVSRKSEA